MLAFAILVFAAQASGSSSPLEPRLGAVLPAAGATELLHQCSRPAPRADDGAWVPSLQQISDLEARLPEALTRALSKRSFNNDRANRIARQYAGFTSGGRKYIYVNAFPEGNTASPFPGAAAPDWKRQAVRVCDGGAVYFGVEYDPATKTFSNFEFNGAI